MKNYITDFSIVFCWKYVLYQEEKRGNLFEKIVGNESSYNLRWGKGVSGKKWAVSFVQSQGVTKYDDFYKIKIRLAFLHSSITIKETPCTEHAHTVTQSLQGMDMRTVEYQSIVTFKKLWEYVWTNMFASEKDCIYLNPVQIITVSVHTITLITSVVLIYYCSKFCTLNGLNIYIRNIIPWY